MIVIGVARGIGPRNNQGGLVGEEEVEIEIKAVINDFYGGAEAVGDVRAPMLELYKTKL